MSDDLAAHVFQSLSRKTGFPEEKIERGSELLSDLGLDGDDAAEFFDNLGRYFGTDLSALQRDWHHYFRPEPTIASIFRKTTGIPSLRAITVEDVMQAVERGTW